jgi:alpha-2-macroglobulin
VALIDRVWVVLKLLVATLWGALRSVLSALVGDVEYRAPGWAQWLADTARQAPLKTTVAALLIGYAAVSGWRWWHAPKPVDPELVAVTLTAPVVTDYTTTPPTVATLNMQFSRSVAPLEDLERAPAGVTLEPALEGAWRWVSDSELQFTPANDWPIAVDFDVTLDRRQTVAPDVRRLSRRSYRVSSIKTRAIPKSSAAWRRLVSRIRSMHARSRSASR